MVKTGGGGVLTPEQIRTNKVKGLKIKGLFATKTDVYSQNCTKTSYLCNKIKPAKWV